MSETNFGNPFEGRDPALSAHLEERLQGNSAHLLPEGHKQGDVIVGIPINPAFNAGVEQGPWQASPEDLEWGRKAGWSDEKSHALADLREKQRQITVNTYPVGPVGEMKEVADELSKQDDELLGKR